MQVYSHVGRLSVIMCALARTSDGQYTLLTMDHDVGRQAGNSMTHLL